MNEWKTWGLSVLGVVAIFVGGLGVGRLTASGPKVVETEKVVYRDRVVTETVTVQAEAKTLVVYREKVTKPDGTVTERTAERTDSHATARTDTTSTADRSGETFRMRVETARPDWRVGILVGASLEFAPFAPAFDVGVHAEYRLAGPFSVGAWALFRPSTAFQPTPGVSAGLSLSVEF